MSQAALQARVRTMRYEADGIVSVELTPLQAGTFPPFDAGAHIDLHLPSGVTRSYSLLNSTDERDRYVLGILSDVKSRGGSRYVHEQLRVGSVLGISAPRNNFALDESAAHSVLIAGGIGITPILCMYRRLRALGHSVQVLYCGRKRSQAAFLAELDALGGVDTHFDDEAGGPPNLKAYLEKQPRDAHVYCCGPAPMLGAFEDACRELGIEHVHLERFSADTTVARADDAGYIVELAQSGKTVEVPAGKTLLETLLEAGIDAEYSCMEGICGACETRVLEGEPDHRDSVLSTAEKASNKVMMICISGCKSGKLVLDL
ncbi:PDR/VanB family oxidoreductase [Chitinasiproducens palmae]|uniref:Ferredoxin-NADP reductase n=1 Tax=Chitinasiproducens palmae TaxID=1770053 RepID=A0A1H2PPN5_9BURK|nr:PDR/VanB family oxidoreductase [Chitinasiproducens palmae]SDV48645.1 Ferredoxin-NADP reductase [Chitinasiproducens palmae]